MKITINVCDKLFAKDAENKFQDFFERVITDIASGLNDGEYSNLCGRYEMETATLLKQAFKKGEYDNE